MEEVAAAVLRPFEQRRTPDLHHPREGITPIDFARSRPHLVFPMPPQRHYLATSTGSALDSRITRAETGMEFRSPRPHGYARRLFELEVCASRAFRSAVGAGTRTSWGGEATAHSQCDA